VVYDETLADAQRVVVSETATAWILQRTEQGSRERACDGRETSVTDEPFGWLQEQLAAASPDLLRAMIASFAQALMGAEADEICGAGYGERSEERTNCRNGYRPRGWDTRVGTIELAIPRLRTGSYFPDWLLERRRRADRR
jgi:hypothetical protein